MWVRIGRQPPGFYTRVLLQPTAGQGPSACAPARLTPPACLADPPRRVWDLREGRCVERLVGHEGPIWSMQGDGGRLVASVGDDGTLRVWDLELHR